MDNIELAKMMKEMMDQSLAEHHNRTKGEIIDQVKVEINQVKSEIIQNIDSKMKETTTELKGEIKDLRDDCRKQEQKITQCQKNTNYLMDMQRKKNIIVYGLANVNGRENRKEQLVNLFKEKMKTSFTKNDIDYFLNLSKSRERAPVLVRVRTLEMKYEIFRQRRLLKGSNIFIDDDLDKDAVKERRQLRTVMKQKKEEGKQAVIKHNKLYVDGELYRIPAQELWEPNMDEAANLMDIDDEGTPHGNNQERNQINKDGDGEQALANTSTNKKRLRSPKDKQGNVVKKQLSMKQFLKREQIGRARSNSEGSIVNKIVNEMEQRTPLKDKKVKNKKALSNRDENKGDNDGTGIHVRKETQDENGGGTSEKKTDEGEDETGDCKVKDRDDNATKAVNDENQDNHDESKNDDYPNDVDTE